MRAAFKPPVVRLKPRRLRALSWHGAGWLCFVLWLLQAAAPQQVHAQNNGATEASVKIAFVYNFAKFTEWPAGALATAQKQVSLCVIGDADAFGAGLSAVDGRPLSGRELKVRRIARAHEMAGCHILFITRSEERRLADLLAAAHAQSILTISDINDFTDAEGIIGLINVDNKVQFEINIRSAKAANLKISSEVLKLARTVVGK